MTHPTNWIFFICQSQRRKTLTFEFTLPPTSEVTQFIPNKLLEIASKLPDTNISLPTVDKVLEAIQNAKAAEVSKLEWVYCIYAKAEWDKQNIDRSKKTSAAIWEVAISQSWLQNYLLYRIALYYSGQQEQVLAKSLAESFEIFANDKSVNQRLPVKIILALRSQDSGRKLAKIACEENLNRTEFLKEIDGCLPIYIPGFTKFTEYIVSCFLAIISPNQQQINWLLRCLDEMSTMQQIQAVNHLLTTVHNNVDNNHPPLVEWLRKNYRYGDKWYQLSEPGRKKLREWIGGINYRDFQRLVDLILNRLELQDFESNQLRRRSEFWANYSNRFERLRILLPRTSQIAIGDQINGDVDLLKDDGSDQTEVCIFDFGEWFVVEFFRGRGSETRLIPNNSRNQQILFGESTLSVKQIRCLGGDRHDHVFLWQVFSPKWLKNHGILPNSNTQPSRNPTADQLRTRETRLERWTREIESLEREAIAYCNRIGFA
jgi:hypothetical protein